MDLGNFYSKWCVFQIFPINAWWHMLVSCAFRFVFTGGTPVYIISNHGICHQPLIGAPPFLGNHHLFKAGPWGALGVSSLIEPFRYDRALPVLDFQCGRTEKTSWTVNTMDKKMLFCFFSAAGSLFLHLIRRNASPI